MKMAEWHVQGIEPTFATVEQWIIDQLGTAGAEEEAMYAIGLQDEDHPKGLCVRILFATDRGLFDVVWERPDRVEDRRLVSRHYRWRDVVGLRLSGETRIDPHTLTHTDPSWTLEMADPEIRIVDAVDSRALLELWKACDEAIGKGEG